jgi:hypothetical protein
MSLASIAVFQSASMASRALGAFASGWIRPAPHASASCAPLADVLDRVGLARFLRCSLLGERARFVAHLDRARHGVGHRRMLACSSRGVSTGRRDCAGRSPPAPRRRAGRRHCLLTSRRSACGVARHQAPAASRGSGEVFAVQALEHLALLALALLAAANSSRVSGAAGAMPASVSSLRTWSCSVDQVLRRPCWPACSRSPTSSLLSAGAFCVRVSRRGGLRQRLLAHALQLGALDDLLLGRHRGVQQFSMSVRKPVVPSGKTTMLPAVGSRPSSGHRAGVEVLERRRRASARSPASTGGCRPRAAARSRSPFARCRGTPRPRPGPRWASRS